MNMDQQRDILKYWKQGRYTTAIIARVVGVSEPDACRIIADEREKRLFAKLNQVQS